MENTARVLDITETQNIESKALALPEKAHMIVVDSNDGMVMADITVNDIDAMIKEIDGTFEPMASKAFQAHRTITGKWKEVKQPLVDARVYLIEQVKTWKRKLKAEQEAEEARLREIARKEEEERILREAAELEAEGRQDEADEIMSEPITYVAPAVKMDIPKVDNRMYQTRTKVTVKDRMAFLQAVPASTLLECLNEGAWVAIESGLARKAKALGKAFKINGCVVQEV